MRRFGNLLPLLGLSIGIGALGAGLTALDGCSADANAPIEDVDAASAASGPDGSYATDDDAGSDPVVTTDSGTHDASHDAGLDAYVRPDTGAPGTPCGPVGQNESQPCGLCGNQSRVCLPGADGGGQKPGLWSDWGACTGEVTGPGTCDPHAADAGTEACGNCGYRPVICQADCHVAQGIVCQGEPANACSPTDTKFTLAQGCSANMGREQVCGNDCTWGAPSSCEAPPVNPNNVTLSKTSGTTVSGTFALAKTKTGRVLEVDSCPTTIGTDNAQYVYVEIFNKDTKAHTVDVWTSKVSVVQDNVIAWYNTPVIPTTTAERQTCSGQVLDGCSSTRSLTPACTGSNFGGLVDGDAPTIPAGGAIEIYVSGYDSSTPSGNFLLNVRTR